MAFSVAWQAQADVLPVPAPLPQVNLVRPFIVTALNRFAHTAAMEEIAERGALAAAANAGRRAARGAAGDAGDARPRRQLRR